MKNKLMAALLSTAMILSLVGCGSQTAPASAPAAEATETTEASASESTGSGELTGTLKIGMIGPLTGAAALYGTAVTNGTQIAVDEINAISPNFKMEYNPQDDEHDAEKSVNAYNNLKDWDVQAIVGCVTTTPCVAVAAEANADRVFMLTPSASATSVTENADDVFQLCFSDPNQGIAAAQYIGQNGVASKVAVIYDSSDVYSSGIYEKFAAEAGNQGIEIVSAEAFTADNKTDFTTQIQKAKDADADLLFLPFYYQEATLVLSQCNTLGFAPTFFGCDGLDGILAVENFDVSLAEGVMLLTPFAADAADDATKSFVTKYVEQYGETPNQFAADAYDAAYIVKAAMEKEGCTPDMSASDICDKLMKAMVEIKVDGLTGESMTWTADGEVNKAPKAVVIKDGVYVAM